MELSEFEVALKDQPRSANINSEKVMEHLQSDNVVAYRIEHEKNKTVFSVISILNGSLRRLKMEVYDDGDNSPQIIADNRSSLDGNEIKTKIHSLIIANTPSILSRVEELDLEDLNQLLSLYYILLTNNGFTVINKAKI